MIHKLTIQIIIILNNFNVITDNFKKQMLYFKLWHKFYHFFPQKWLDEALPLQHIMGIILLQQVEAYEVNFLCESAL